ncbi:hypothetical protein [Agrobacterium tumefaciens]|uniref:hypothetical protein n=1 Tax=Agrobacterium tumefaciens TaxID=358 RepID=UPI0021CF8A1B|nr:hypothetical protein [Agrobacterium tumefaciens]UXS05276.1 hypothetical protein FY156_29120 [Agrobacterium tumefaciens]
MKFAVGIFGLFLGSLVLPQSYAVTAGSGLPEDQATGSAGAGGMAQPQTKDSNESNCAVRFSAILAHMEKRFEESPEGSVSDLQPFYRDHLPFACSPETFENMARGSTYFKKFYALSSSDQGARTYVVVFEHPQGAKSHFTWAEKGNKLFTGMYYPKEDAHVRLDFDRGIVDGQWGRRDK